MASEIYYASKPAICEDGRVRKVRVKCYRYDGSMAADTFFSVPAHVYVRGKYVHGYVTGSDDLPEGISLAFRAHNVCKHLIVEPV